jgi:hypothetical protein
MPTMGMSALRCKADAPSCDMSCPLLTHSRHDGDCSFNKGDTIGGDVIERNPLGPVTE